jgi:cytochrome c oxidase subunit 2
MMTGWVEVMKPDDFQHWIGGGSGAVPMEVAGASLFQQLGCPTCHGNTSTSRGPSLSGLFGARVLLANGREITADDNYIRKSIVEPASDILAGYPPIMPTFKGQVNDQQLLQLIAYVKSIGQGQKEAAK